MKPRPWPIDPELMLAKIRKTFNSTLTKHRLPLAKFLVTRRNKAKIYIPSSPGPIIESAALVELCWTFVDLETPIVASMILPTPWEVLFSRE